MTVSEKDTALKFGFIFKIQTYKNIFVGKIKGPMTTNPIFLLGLPLRANPLRTTLIRVLDFQQFPSSLAERTERAEIVANDLAQF